MADADHEVHKVLYREAAQITLRRGYLDDQYNFLANTSYVTFPLQFIPRYGEAMKMAVEIAALQAALGESYYQMNQLQSEVAQNAADLQQAVGRYSGVADGAELPGAAVNFDPPPPPPGGGAAGWRVPDRTAAAEPHTKRDRAAVRCVRRNRVRRRWFRPDGDAGRDDRLSRLSRRWPGAAASAGAAARVSAEPGGGIVTGAVPAAGQLARHAGPAPRQESPSARRRTDSDKDKADDDTDR